MVQYSKAQESALAKLETAGFEIDRVSEFEDEKHPTIFLSKRVSSYSTRYAEVDSDGLVNGNSDVDAEIAGLLRR